MGMGLQPLWHVGPAKRHESIRHRLRCGESILKHPDDEVEKALICLGVQQPFDQKRGAARTAHVSAKEAILYKEVDLRNSTEKQC